ncbi:hypothetical protein [Hypericibacter sp.]|uniref:hypothetical protein n=1 Tax=Hypericibacter sp. TaxID=2705401 RepID=UPI003D6D4A5C
MLLLIAPMIPLALLGIYLVRGHRRRLALAAVVGASFAASSMALLAPSWAAITLPLPICLFATTLIIASDRRPGLLEPKAIARLLAIVGVAVPLLPIMLLVMAMTGNPWDELCSSGDSACLLDPSVWAKLVLGAWTTIVTAVGVLVLLSWELCLLVKGRSMNAVGVP